MKFEKDVFISYAHLDDKTLDEGEEGWITEFHRLLQTRLEQTIGHTLNIWRDERLTGNEMFSPEIMAQLPKLKVMVSIITPRYIDSKWCTQELDAFYNAAGENGGISIGNKSRIFKVVKTPIDREEIKDLPGNIPKIFDEILDYKFYTQEKATGKFKEFNRYSWADNKIQQAFMDKLDDVAQDIVSLIKKMNKSGSEEIPERKIFLAETTYDLQNYRDKLVRELQEAGFSVLPDKNLPNEVNKFSEEVKNGLDESILSIHLVSSTNYATQPEGADKSTVILQNEIAANKSEAGNFNRIIWIPPSTPEASTNENSIKLQNEFVNGLKQNSKLQAGADLLVGTLEECKQVIFDTIKRMDDEEKAKQEALINAEKKTTVGNAAATTDTGKKSGPKLVYLVCDQRDLDTTRPLEDLISDSGNEVLLPLFEGDLAQLRQAHLDNLKLCDAVIIYYGAGNYRWAGSMKSDLLRLPALGRSTQLLDKLIFLAGPADKDKESFKANDFTIVNGMTGFTPELCNDFIEKLKQ